LPHVETVIRVRRRSSSYQSPERTEESFYISSIPENKYTPEQWMNLIRGHWGGIEIRNHWRKDACLLEDKTRSRNPNIVASLAMLRNCCLQFFQKQKKHPSLPAFTEAVAADSKLAFQMIKDKS
jgi:predicted transposase YbfD/YdcC